MPEAIPNYDRWKLDTPPRLDPPADAPGPWSVEMAVGGRWVRVATGFASRDAAEWHVGLWKQQHGMTGDPFRYRCG